MARQRRSVTSGIDRARAEVRRLYQNRWWKFRIRCETFHTEFPTRELRQAHARERTADFLRLFDFEGDDLFQRTAEFWETRADVLASYDPPNLDTINRADGRTVLTRSRGRWWSTSGLPMTWTEKAWLRKQPSGITEMEGQTK
jgi:hypothetical protein